MIVITVTFHAKNRRTRSYKSEKGALKAVWKWLKESDDEYAYAVLIGPIYQEPRLIRNWQELPFSDPVEVDFLQTPEWRKLKQEAFELYGNYCACCGKGPKDGVVLHVDHIKPRSLYPELRSDINNLQILCEEHNTNKSNTSEKKWR
ncbi:HNH endonuclease [Shewanella loihica PV-4]|uniref:HNH endonuclease n=2 Tax=Shewanella TaxID=22 RepID=A3QCH7_SHELP|nr:HNH endonuclease [Shewanella loihica PV-4]